MTVDRSTSEIVKAMVVLLRAGLRCCPPAHRAALMSGEWYGSDFVVGISFRHELPHYNVGLACEEEIDAALAILRAEERGSRG